jgi:RNA polymerase sigma-70 factor (ECF subfamily)
VGADEEAEFAALAERQWRFACRVAWAVLRNTHDAEDAAQEAFLRILKARAWRGLRDERAFVARTVWRAAVDRARELAVRADAPRRFRESDSGGGETMDDVADAAPGPEEAAVAADWERAVHRLIDSLPEDLRQPLALSVEMNSREIGEAMGIAEGTVRTRLMRARQMLREKIAAMEERRYARG